MHTIHNHYTYNIYEPFTQTYAIDIITNINIQTTQAHTHPYQTSYSTQTDQLGHSSSCRVYHKTQFTEQPTTMLLDKLKHSKILSLVVNFKFTYNTLITGQPKQTITILSFPWPSWESIRRQHPTVRSIIASATHIKYK